MSGTADLNADDWQRVSELFDRVVALPAEQRAAFLEAELGDRPRLAAEVIALAESHEADPEFLARPPARIADLAAGSAADEAESEPDRIGLYRVVRRIGAGGMGAVYLAERDDDEFRRRVAIKVLKRGMDSEQILARFRAERQILAGLDHPGIARMYDGGMTADGRPYFVLEHVEGALPIDRYCEENGLDLPARLRLFRAACDAVQYAHRRLIVHRDLKPTNLLVSEEGELKLVDFGIAKLLDPAAADVTRPALTHAQLRPMTPEYASPEQIRGEPLSTTSDVFSLGVILYELLTGRLPFPRTEGGSRETGRRDRPPEKPSTVAARPHPQEPGPAAPPGRLSADLDNIVLMALRPQPERRYPSVEALAADVDRHLQHRPVLARPQTASYRMRRFVERNRAAVALAAAAVLALVVGLAGTAWQAREARQERDRARTEARQAEQVTDLLVELFEASNPGRRSDALSMTVREFADRAEEELAGELEEQPEVLARLETAMARVNGGLARNDRASRLFESALARQRALYPEGHSDLAETLYWQAGLLLQRGEREAAEAAAHEALELRRRLPDRNPLREADYEMRLAQARNARGDDVAAERLIESALAVRRELLPADHPRIGDSLSALAVLAYRRGEYGRAVELAEKALDIQVGRHGETHQAVAHELNNLGAYLLAAGAYERAAAAHRRALAIRVAVWGPDHPFVAFSLVHLGRLALILDRPEEALERFRRALELRVAAYGPAHRLVATAQTGVGAAWTALGEPDRALEPLGEAVRTLETLGAEDRLANALLESGHAHREAGRLPRAVAFYREALDVRLRSAGGEHPKTAGVQAALAAALVETGELGEAEALVENALGSLLTSLPEGHLDAVSAHLAQGDLERARGRQAEARRAYGTAIETLEARLPPGHRRIAAAAARLAGLGASG